MADPAGLAQRIRAEFDSRAERRRAADEERSRASQERERRLNLFVKTCEDLKGVWKPRFEEFSKQFGSELKVVPKIDRATREVKVAFPTELATVTLKLAASANSDVTGVVFDYDLLIIPSLLEYEHHSRLEMPLNKIDRDALGKWLDDRLVASVKAYLAIQDNEFYLRRALVEDPITKEKFLREDAVTHLDHAGQTIYFSSEDSLRQYKQRHQIP
jgi:hypothetical protein